MRRATLNDVARVAGVSAATVSKVLNRRRGFSDETRERVENAIAELGYVPITRDRSPGRTGAVMAVFDTLYTPYSLRVLEGLVTATQRVDRDLVVQVTDAGHHGSTSFGLDARRVRSFADKGHAGVIVVTSAIGDEVVGYFRDNDLPLVSIDASAALRDDVPNIGSTHWRGGQQAGRHLVDLGHRRIAFVGGSPGNPGIRERLAGFRDALTSAGVAVDEQLIAETGLEHGAEALSRMLDLAEPPTAVFCSTDGAAAQVLDMAAQRGVPVPDDLSVVGYDDTFSAAIPGFPLTTVRAPLEAVGEAAVETVLRLADGRAARGADMLLATRLVVRGTTAAPRREASA